MRYERLVKRLEKELAYKEDEPYFIEDIYRSLKEYSRQTTFNVLEEAIKEGKIKKFSRGIYYAKRVPSINEVIYKKYLNDLNGTCGIYGKLWLDLFFGISTQYPLVHQIISNKASRKFREFRINGQRIMLYKSRCKITNKNCKAYTLMEFFNQINIDEYTGRAKENIIEYVKENNISKKDINNLIPFFPARVMKNMALTGIIYEATER